MMGIVDFGVGLGPIATCRASLEMSMERSAECQCSSLRTIQSPGGAQIGLSLPRRGMPALHRHNRAHRCLLPETKRSVRRTA